MALLFTTPTPKALLAKLKKAIDDNHIDTWSHDEDGDFTHAPGQWAKRAWFRPYISQGVLQFGLLGQENVVMSKAVYGVYHGRFAEMMLTHFDDTFSTAMATALKDEQIDTFKGVPASRTGG